MSLVSRTFSRAWIVVVVLAGSFLIWTDSRRAERVNYVSSLAGQSPLIGATASAAAPTSSSTHGHVLPLLIVPERNEVGFQWLAQTRQMFEQRCWRVRHTDDDNAPFGREVSATSPYRWWFGFVAWLDHMIAGQPLERSVERAALYVEPLLQLLLLIGATGLVAWRFGALAGSATAIGLTTVFPFSAGFLPGVPDHQGLARVCAFGSVIVALAGLKNRRFARCCFASAGILGGIGMWVDVPTQLPILAGISLGALMIAATARLAPTRASDENEAGAPILWQIWAAAGAATILGGYLIEYFPAHLASWRLDFIHPIYGVGWIGMGKLLEWSIASGRRRKLDWRRGQVASLILAAAAVAAVPIAMHWSGTNGWLATNLSSLRLTNQPGGIVAANFWAWLTRDGLNATVWATLLPLGIIVPAIGSLRRRSTSAESRESIAFAFGPVLIGLGFASLQLTGWHLLDLALLALLIATISARAFVLSETPIVGRQLAGAIGARASSRPTTGARASSRAATQPIALSSRQTIGESTHPVATRRSTFFVCAIVITLFAIPGAVQLIPPRSAGARIVLTPSEAQELIERDLARWFASHTDEPRAVVFAPPHETTTLSFYGGLRGLGTFDRDNRAGFGVSLAITAARTMEEVEAAIQARGIKYIVIPSWDPFFDDFARLYLTRNFSNRTSFLIGELRRWNLPLWLRPVAYQMPVIAGFENQSVLVFEVVEEQSPSAAASRLTEYFVETGRVGEATTAVESLRRFPGDVGALAARAQALSAQEDASGFTQTLELLLSRLSTGADRYLPWDRRVSVAAVLAQGGQIDLARQQFHRCLTELTEKKLRALSTGALFKFLVLSRGFKSEIADPKLRALAMNLLPPELRAQL